MSGGAGMLLTVVGQDGRGRKRRERLGFLRTLLSSLALVAGLFAMLKVLKDPAVQQALGFAVGLARHFGADGAPATR